MSAPKAFDSAYPGSMFPREDGDYVLRNDNASLAAALLEGIAQRDRDIDDLKDALGAEKNLRGGLLAALIELQGAEEAMFPPATAGQDAQTAWAVRIAEAHTRAKEAIASASPLSTAQEQNNHG